MAFPIRSKTAREIARCLWKYIALFGPPSTIITDNGGEFVNDIIDALCRITGIDHITTAPYHPNANGRVERLNQTLIQSLRAHCLAEPDNWDLWLDYVLFAYRTRPHTATGQSPFYLLFGREAPLFATAGEEDNSDLVSEELITRRLDEIRKLVEVTRPEIATRCNTTVATKQQHRQDQAHPPQHVHVDSLDPGQLVWVRVGPKVTKLAPRYLGPYKVQRRTRRGNYILTNSKDEPLKNSYPLDRLKLQITPTDTTEPIAPDNELLDVEDILDHRIHKGRVEYLVKWAGYPEDDASWEPESQFVDLSKIDEYWTKTEEDPHGSEAMTCLPLAYF
jgi:hypothetical protein